MAAAIAFNQALIRCGFNQDTAVAIVGQGFDSLAIVAAADDKDIDGMIKNVRDTRREMGAAAPGNVTFIFLAIKKFKVMQFWAKELVRCNRPLNIGLFIEPLIGDYLLHFEANQRRDEMDPIEPEKPGDLTDLDKWEVWFERFDSYCSNIYGAAKCPIKYIYREQEIPDPQDLNGPWDNHDDFLVACTHLQGNWFNVDNKRVYDELKALYLGKSSTPVAWTFIKTFDRQRDGRSALLALKRQCEGTAAKQTRKAAAYAKIATAKYSGQSKRFTLDQYIQIHQSAHNTLADLEEPIAETKKVSDFLAGITDPRLNTAKDLVMGDRAKLDNFEACQQYLKTISFTKANQDILQRNISNTNTGGQPRGSKRGGKGGGGGGGKALGRSYTNEEWQKLTPEQRDKIRALRAAQKKQRTDPNNNNNTRGGGGDLHSNVSSITTGDSQQVATATTNNNANNQNQNDGATQVTNGSRQGGANSRG